MARWRGKQRWPPHLAEFREEDWPYAPGECLKRYGCHARTGYVGECTPAPGARCGDEFYAMLAVDYPDDAELAARHRRGDAFERFHRARLAWIGEGNEGYITEFIAGCQREREIRRYG